MDGSLPRRMGRVFALAMMGALGFACSSSTAPDDGGPDDGGPDDGGPNGGGGGGTSPTYSVTIHPLSGVETSIRAVVWVGPRAVTRAEAGNAGALRTSGFHDITLETDTDGGERTRNVSAQKGQIVTIIAIESEGLYNVVQFPGPPPPQNNVTEFVSFTGAEVQQPEVAVATFSAGDQDVNVRVNFRRMPQIAIMAIGATGIDFDLDLPPVRMIPERANIYDRAFAGTSVIFAPTAMIYVTMQFRSSSTARLEARPSGEFIRWEGACGGQGQVCDLRFGGPAGGFQDQATTLFTGYLACTFAGAPTAYSGYGFGAPVPPNCTIVRP